MNLKFCRLLVPITVMFLLSCGGGSGSDSNSSAAAAANELSQGVQDIGSRSSANRSLDCSGSADKALGGGALCADTGFRSGDGFAFPNWASYKFDGDDVSVSDMIALFGASEVCVDVSSSTCTLNIGAENLRQSLGDQIAGGRCEGLVLLSGLIASGRIDLAQFGTDIRGISDLGPRNVGLVAAVNYWWATQFDPSAVEAASTNRVEDLSDFLTRLSLELARGTNSTIGIYSDGIGHALLPVAITQNNDGTFAISVYDSNFPSEIRQLEVDIVQNQWSYEAGDLVSGNKTLMQGTGGSIDFTPFESREDLRLCDGCGGDASTKSDTVISVPGITLTK